jgi:lipopolysaccharide/colanic/teichoic acid biosynthesis glycosyltransferase
VLKIRTMRGGEANPEIAVSAEGSQVETLVAQMKRDSHRTMRVGRFLRRTSIDELPQLWNVVVGHMSLVGPRPLRPFEVAALNGWQRRRQEVRPGITGPWQVEGRSDIDWTERMQLDYGYTRNWTLLGDLRVLGKTPMAVLRRQGAR